MKFSTQEEYGLRCLLRIAKEDRGDGLTIPEISAAEGLSQANVAKLLRILRMGGFIESSRGQAGGYKLAKKPEEIVIAPVLSALGGRLFESSFCLDHAGVDNICTHSIDCSLRSLWRAVQKAVDSVTMNLTLRDMMNSEEEVKSVVETLIEETG